jgi:hypothetical protein
MTRAQSFKPPPLTPNGDITMKPYTVEVTWRVPEYTHLTVLADSPAQAIELALATVANNPDAHERTLDYESSGADVITGLWEGEEPYPDPPGSTLPLPQTPDQDLESAIEAAVAHVRKGSSAPVELHNLLTAFDAWRGAR